MEPEQNRSLKAPEIEILLSTCNGELYLAELLDSILSQDYTNWRILIRDDGSTDKTVRILKDYQKKHPKQIEILQASENIGFTQSFNLLLKACKANYIAFCDQDDIWKNDKLSCQIETIRSAEGRFGKHLPLLVHSDLEVVNQDMKRLSPSMWHFQNIDPDKMKSIKTLLVHNFVTGCTILMNRALADRVIPIPGAAVSFDWWTALIALEKGEILTINKSLVFYRQHLTNVVGTMKWDLRYIVLAATRNHKVWKQSLKKSITQAAALNRHKDNKDRKIIDDFSMIGEKGWFDRKQTYLQLGIKRYGFLRQLSALIFI